MIYKPLKTTSSVIYLHRLKNLFHLFILRSLSLYIIFFSLSFAASFFVDDEQEDGDGEKKKPMTILLSYYVCTWLSVFASLSCFMSRSQIHFHARHLDFVWNVSISVYCNYLNVIFHNMTGNVGKNTATSLKKHISWLTHVDVNDPYCVACAHFFTHECYRLAS